MGIVYKQSFRNTLITYLGFGIGALNTLFLYTRFLTDEYYGLVGVILSTAALLMPLLAFGVPNALVKYYSSFAAGKTSESFLTLMLLLPIAMIIPIAVLSYAANETIGHFLAHKNSIVKGYVWHIFLIGMAMAYFEVFYSWAKVQLRSVVGNFMKEVFVRAGVMILLLAVYLKAISVATFLNALVGLYIVRTLIMMIYASHLKLPRFRTSWPSNTRAILQYSTLIILGGSAAVLLLELDRFMINQFIKIENVAYYSVAIFIATVVAVPSRAMHQVTYPLTAELLNKNDMPALSALYKKSSLTLFIVSGLIFLLILLNIQDLYLLLPAAYRGGFIVVLLISLAKLYDALLGNNNAILYNSDYYKTVLVMGIMLAVMTIFFNLWLIPKYGINGAALATFLAIFIYNTVKLWYVNAKFRLMPFTAETMKVLGLILLLSLTFYLLDFKFHPLAKILLKSIFIIIVYLGVLYRFKISEDVYAVLSKFLKRTGKGHDA